MDWLNLVLNVAIMIIILIGGGLLLKSYLSSYFSKKGRNLATKEDIREITEKVEAVRTDYAKQLHTYQLVSGKEFDILYEVWHELTELQRAALALDPLLGSLSINETKEVVRQKRQTAFYERCLSLSRTVERNRPFYSKKIYALLQDIMLDYSIENDDYGDHSINRDKNYRVNVIEDQERIQNAIDKISEEIRKRVAG